MSNTVIVPNVISLSQHEQLRAWGVLAPAPKPGLSDADGAFVTVPAPEGWRVGYCAHSMYRELLDSRGFRRALYFAKMAFWDNRIYVHSTERAVSATVSNVARDRWTPRVVLGKKWILWEGEPANLQTARNEAEAALERLYPGAKSADAYWDLAVPEGAKKHVEQA